MNQNISKLICVPELSPHITLLITQDHHLNKEKVEKVVLKSVWMGSRESEQQFLEKVDQAKHQDYYRFPRQKLNVSRIPHNPEKIMISKTGSFSPKGQFRSSSVFNRVTYIFHCWHRDQSWVPSVGPEAIIPNDKNCHTKMTLECIFWGPNLTSYVWQSGLECISMLPEEKYIFERIGNKYQMHLFWYKYLWKKNFNSSLSSA